MPSASAVKVIVADDQLTIRSLVKLALGSIGIENVRMTTDGQQALEQVHRELPTLVLTDVNMPNLDGLGLLKAIREAPATRSLPVIMLTGVADRDVVAQAMALKVNNFLVKPFSGERLKEKIEAVLGKLC